MKTFLDNAGTEWRLSLDIAAASRLRDAGYDLLDDVRNCEMLADPYCVAPMLTMLLRKQAEDRGFDDEQLGELVTSCYVIGQAALTEECASFFCRLGRTVQATVLQKVVPAATIRTQEMVMEKLKEGGLDEAIEAELRKALVQLDEILRARPGNGSGTPLESSASIPDP